MKYSWLIAATLLASTNALAQELKIDMLDLSTGKSIGIINIKETKYGTVFTPNLKNLSPGAHGFHIHENPSCQSSTKNGQIVLGGAAGGHYDPAKTGQHGSPWTDDNHLGDLPALYVDLDGNATQAVLAPRLKIKDLEGRSLMIHAGGDNHSDMPKPLGGGGARMACGVIDS